MAYGAGAATAHSSPLIEGGQEIAGGTLSLTVIVCVQVVELPQTSVAKYVLVIVYLFAQL